MKRILIVVLLVALVVLMIAPVVSAKGHTAWGKKINADCRSAHSSAMWHRSRVTSREGPRPSGPPTGLAVPFPCVPSRESSSIRTGPHGARFSSWGTETAISVR